MTTTVAASWLLPGADRAAAANQSITVDGGKITRITAGDGDGTLVMPALANAHDHARIARLSQTGSYDVPLEAWLPYLTLLPAVDPYLSSAVSFARSARGGVGAVMAHYTRVQGLTDFPTEAKAVAQAARDVGIRMALAVHCRDLNPLVYDPHEKLLADLSPAACECVTRRFLRKPVAAKDQVAMVETVAREIEGDGVTVQYGPAGVQWCTDEMLRLIGEASAASNRRVHMHLLETQYQRNWADRTFPQGIVRYLDGIGLVNERVSFAHCIYLRPDEMELIAERGATIVVNTSSNFIVSSGLAPLGEFIKRGCRVAMGLDGLAFDEDEDALREMRLVYNVHKASGFDIRVSGDELMRFATAHGRFAVTGFAEEGLAPGAAADLLTLDWTALSAELIEPDVPPFDLLLAKGVKRHIKDLTVAGRIVVRGGQVTGIDLPALEGELLATLRAKYPTTADIRAAMPELKSALRRHYTGPLYCA
ncbi:MAG: amidohydrolase family protein [Proteobacteria bacterium]|nr:amidohydrolase family protein [Pseudomonadota bacterium]